MVLCGRMRTAGGPCAPLRSGRACSRGRKSTPLTPVGRSNSRVRARVRASRGKGGARRRAGPRTERRPAPAACRGAPAVHSRGRGGPGGCPGPGSPSGRLPRPRPRRALGRRLAGRFRPPDAHAGPQGRAEARARAGAGGPPTLPLAERRVSVRLPGNGGVGEAGTRPRRFPYLRGASRRPSTRTKRERSGGMPAGGHSRASGGPSVPVRHGRVGSSPEGPECHAGPRRAPPRPIQRRAPTPAPAISPFRGQPSHTLPGRTDAKSLPALNARPAGEGGAGPGRNR